MSALVISLLCSLPYRDAKYARGGTIGDEGFAVSAAVSCFYGRGLCLVRGEDQSTRAGVALAFAGCFVWTREPKAQAALVRTAAAARPPSLAPDIHFICRRRERAEMDPIRGRASGGGYSGGLLLEWRGGEGRGGRQDGGSGGDRRPETCGENCGNLIIGWRGAG